MRVADGPYPLKTRKIRYFGSAGTPSTPPSGPTMRSPEPRKCIRWFGTPLWGWPPPTRPANTARLSPAGPYPLKTRKIRYFGPPAPREHPRRVPPCVLPNLANAYVGLVPPCMAGLPLHGPLTPPDFSRNGSRRRTCNPAATTFLAVLSFEPVHVVVYACFAPARALPRPSSCNSVPRGCPTPVSVAGPACRGARRRYDTCATSASATRCALPQ